MNIHVLDAIDPVVLGVQLSRARKARGLTQQAVAEALGLSRTTVITTEKGTRRPQPEELVRLATLYGRRVGELVRPVAVQPQDEFVVQFRTARMPRTNERDADRETDIHVFEALCRDYAELEQLTRSPLPRRYPEVYDIRRADPEDAAEEVASSERNRLGLGDGPISDLQGVLEADVGLRIFAPTFADTRLVGLFSYTDELGGCIAVNGRHPQTRRRWTVVHEYGHFLTDRYRAEMTVLTTYHRVPGSERFAEAFARCFLLPAPGVVRRFQAVRRAKREPITLADVVILAHLYRVSSSALLLRLEELKLVAGGTWDRLRNAGRKPNAGRASDSLSSAFPAAPALPLRYELLAVQAATAEQLSEERLAQLLRTDIVGARARVQQLTQSGFAEDGELYQLPLDLAVELTTVSR